MKIIPNRTMLLGGKHVERARVVEVADEDGALAIRHGWAAKAPAKAAKETTTPPAEEQKAAE